MTIQEKEQNDRPKQGSIFMLAPSRSIRRYPFPFGLLTPMLEEELQHSVE